MKDTDIIEDGFGEIERKLIRTKVLKEVEEILGQVSNKDENFLYPIIDINSPSDRLIAMNPLVRGKFMGHIYEICTNGVHPTAYVNCGFRDMNKDACNELPVHGGCTFSGNRASADGTWYGWDYGHGGDYMEPRSPYGIANFGRYGKKWMVLDVMRDVIKAIIYIEENS